MKEISKDRVRHIEMEKNNNKGRSMLKKEKKKINQWKPEFFKTLENPLILWGKRAE